MVKKGMARPKGEPTTNVTVRMFVKMKRELEEIARKENRSLANLIVTFLREGLAAREKKGKKG